MARVVILDGNTISIQTQIIEHKHIDDELETTEIVIKNSSQLEPYDMGLQCTITEQAIAEYYITGQDNVVITKRNPNAYTHSITLIEPYKLFERITMSSLQYSQALNTTTYTLLDIVDRALKLVELEDITDLGGKRVYDIDGIGSRDSSDNYVEANLSGLALELYERKAPEMKLNTPTLREIFDEVFLILNGRPYMKSFTVIGIKYYNEINDAIVLSEVSEITGEQNIDKFAQKYDIYMENAISENNLNKQARVYPSVDSWASVRSSETELTTTNFLMEVHEDIERVLKWEIYTDIEIDYTEYNGTTTNNKTFSGVIEVDVTDLLLFKQAWDGLEYEFEDEDTNSTTETWWKDVYINNSLYIDGNQIKGWHEEIDIFTVFTSIKQWHLFLQKAAYDGGYLTVTSGYFIRTIGGSASPPTFNTNLRDFMFRLTYVPKEVVRVQLEKDVKNGVGTLFYNQNARIVDSELLGANAQTKLDREGEKILRFSKTAPLFFNAFQLGDYYGDYKVYKVDNDRQANITLTTAWLSKNYVKKSERINLANMPRQTEITGENTIRNDVYNEYIEVGYSSLSATASINSLGMQTFIKTFQNNLLEGFAIEYATWEGLLIAPCTSQGIGKVISFKFSFDNNISAGEQLTLLGGIYANKFITYAGELGILDDVDIQFGSAFVPTPDTFAQAAIVAQALPEYSTSDMSAPISVELPNLQILKDSGEVYGLSYQLTLATNESEIFIGNKLATDNKLVVKIPGQLYLYSSSSEIALGQRIPDGLTVQTIVTVAPADSSEVRIVVGALTAYQFITFSTNFDTSKYWAIGNANRETFLIVNKVAQSTIYFNPRNKRSD